MNELFEKIPTMTDEEILHDIKEALDDYDPTEHDETLAEMLEALQEGRIDTVKQLGAIDRLTALVIRYREEVLKK